MRPRELVIPGGQTFSDLGICGCFLAVVTKTNDILMASATRSHTGTRYVLYPPSLIFLIARDSVAPPPSPPVKQSGERLNFEPRTLVSYTISGGMGFEKPNVLLQAVVYARGDGPACVMPPPVGLAPHGGEEEGMSGVRSPHYCWPLCNCAHFLETSYLEFEWNTLTAVRDVLCFFFSTPTYV